MKVKKIIVSLLCIAMLVTMVPLIPGWASAEEEGENDVKVVTTRQELQEAINNGHEKIKLANDIVLEEELRIESNWRARSLTLIMDGHNIEADLDNAIFVKNYHVYIGDHHDYVYKNVAEEALDAGKISNTGSVFTVEGKYPVGNGRDRLTSEVNIYKGIEVVSENSHAVFTRGYGPDVRVYGTLRSQGPKATVQNDHTIDWDKSHDRLEYNTLKIMQSGKIISEGPAPAIFVPVYMDIFFDSSNEIKHDTYAGVLGNHQGLVKGMSGIEIMDGEVHLARGHKIVATGQEFQMAPKTEAGVMPRTKGAAIAIYPNAKGAKACSITSEYNKEGCYNCCQLEGPLAVYRGNDDGADLDVASSRFLKVQLRKIHTYGEIRDAVETDGPKPYKEFEIGSGFYKTIPSTDYIGNYYGESTPCIASRLQNSDYDYGVGKCLEKTLEEQGPGEVSFFKGNGLKFETCCWKIKNEKGDGSPFTVEYPDPEDDSDPGRTIEHQIEDGQSFEIPHKKKGQNYFHMPPEGGYSELQFAVRFRGILDFNMYEIKLAERKKEIDPGAGYEFIRAYDLKVVNKHDRPGQLVPLTEALDQEDDQAIGCDIKFINLIPANLFPTGFDTNDLALLTLVDGEAQHIADGDNRNGGKILGADVGNTGPWIIARKVANTDLGFLKLSSKNKKITGNQAYTVSVYPADLDKEKNFVLKAGPKAKRAEIFAQIGDGPEEALGSEGIKLNFGDKSELVVKLTVKDLGETSEYTVTLKKRKPKKIYKHVRQYTIYPGKKTRMATPKGVKRSKIKWKTYSKKTATVNKSGQVTGKKAGVVKIRGLVKYRTKHYYYMYYIRVRPGKPTNIKAKKRGKYVTLSCKLPKNRHGVAVYRAKRNSKGKYKFKRYKVYKCKKAKWSKKIK